MSCSASPTGQSWARSASAPAAPRGRSLAKDSGKTCLVCGAPDAARLLGTWGTLSHDCQIHVIIKDVALDGVSFNGFNMDNYMLTPRRRVS